MSLYSDDPEFKKAFDAHAKDIFEYVKKSCEDYLRDLISEWVDEELKKMGYLVEDKKEEQ